MIPQSGGGSAPAPAPNQGQAVTPQQQAAANAWYAASESNKSEAERYLDQLEQQHQQASDALAGDMASDEQYYQDLLANQGAASNVQGGGVLSAQAYYDFLVEKGRILLESLGGEETSSLQTFLDQTIFDLTPTREIHGENARPGYSGVRRFGVEPTADQIKAMPGYKAMEDQFTRRRTEMTEMQAAEQAMAQQNITAAQMNEAAANARNGGSGDLIAAQARNRREAELRQQQLDQQYADERKRVETEEMIRQQNLAAAQAQGQMLGGEPEKQGKPRQDQYNEFAYGGVTKAAREAAIRRRLRMRG